MSKTQQVENGGSSTKKHAVQPLLGLWFGGFRVQREEAALARFSKGHVHLTLMPLEANFGQYRKMQKAEND